MADSRFEWQFPWNEAIPGAFLGLGIGATGAISFGEVGGVATTSPVPFPDFWAYRYNTTTLLVMAILGGIIGALGFVVRADRQFFNYLQIGIGLGVLLLGTSFLALEKVEVSPDAVVYRSWWGLSRVELKFADMQQLRIVEHYRPWSRYGNWESFHYKMHDGSEGTLWVDWNRSAIFFWAKTHLCQSAMERGVEIKKGSDQGK